MDRQELLHLMRSGQPMTIGQRIKLALLLSTPAILAQLSTVSMQYIDSAMVGHLGALPSASIGLVGTTTWIFGGFCMATCNGFSVQIAQNIGAENFSRARQILRETLTSIIIFSVTLGLIGAFISPFLPHWLGGSAEICSDASSYFLIYALFLPMMQLYFSAGAILQATGNMKTPAILDTMLCVMDVIFNYIFIYSLNMGVKGAALGTGLAETVTAALMLYFLLRRCPELSLKHEKGSWFAKRQTLRNAWGITGPLWLQNIILRGAHIASTVIVAPLGAVSIAANSLAITAESFCYMPGYGLGDAATTLVGQCIGAKRRPLARQFALMITALGAGIMTLLAVLMYILAPQMMMLLTDAPDVISLGTGCLRLEAFAETFYAVAIIANGACIGAGDTAVPSIINLAVIWVARVLLALILTPVMGLMGYWIAMVADLNIRGLLFLGRILGRKWMKKDLIQNSDN